MSPKEYKREAKALLQGRFLVIENKDKKWWSAKLRSGFFDMLAEDDYPVKVVMCSGQAFYFSGGLERKIIYSFIKNLG